ncbi:MAG TPA: hypothetical protein VJX74_08375 [Blastocatellia bacterium]|nr:hypothetical protein [Blastocatellia bacterium]
MLSGKADKKQKGAAKGLKLNSMAALLKERRFDGSFEVAGSKYQFTYAPAKAQVAGERLLLRGRLVVTNSRGQSRTRENVGALLASTQGGIGTAPVRSQALIGGVVPSQPAVPTPQQPSDSKPLPVVESTGPLSFCGVMYFQLEPLDGRALGVAADLSRVQLNVRLAPTDNAGRALHGIYSAIVEALYVKSVDRRLATDAVAELNKALAG